MKVNDDAAGFASRLVDLLKNNGQARRGAGAYLAKKYDVSNVVANAWLNGEYKPGLPVAERIARDHGTTLDELYFAKKPQDKGWPFRFDKSRYDNLSKGQKIAAEAALLGAIVDMEDGRHKAPPKSQHG